jgi:hypothetical protein
MGTGILMVSAKSASGRRDDDRWRFQLEDAVFLDIPKIGSSPYRVPRWLQTPQLTLNYCYGEQVPQRRVSCRARPAAGNWRDND